MTAKKISNVVLVGAGNLAFHLAFALARGGIRILQIVNRTPQKGIKLAEKHGAAYTSDLKEIDRSADLYIIAVSDRAIPLIAENLRLDGKLVVHTSGSMEMDVLRAISQETGVLYPLQTFNEGRRITFRKIPLCIEAGNQANLRLLSDLADKLSLKVYQMDSSQRKVLHMAAVFACNFANFMYAISQDILAQNHLPFDIVRPLIEQTAKNAMHDNPFLLQTGPAIREDENVMREHLRLLAGNPDYGEIYNLISNNIIKHKKHNG
jgi:predicted short-subunit dehydrogenase-like oxidoreductase (DUF2520 family)